MPLCQSLWKFTAVSPVGKWWSSMGSLMGRGWHFSKVKPGAQSPRQKSKLWCGTCKNDMHKTDYTPNAFSLVAKYFRLTALAAQHGIMFAEVQVWILEFWSLDLKELIILSKCGSIETWMMNGWILWSFRIDEPHIYVQDSKRLEPWTGCFGAAAMCCQYKKEKKKQA